ncbi:MAG: thioesterase domain-containing protein [Crocosphaera sp.]|nr:thioesterase domain-containing protein [Crocosphaera sp.]
MEKNPWIKFPPLNDQAKYRLFCFPYAGGGSNIFRRWPTQLSKMVEVCSIRLPGRERRIRETSITNLDCLLETMTPYLLPYLDKPFAFFGHSMGALISFELARYLFKNQGLCPFHLFISAYRYPKIKKSQPPMSNLPESLFIEEIRRLNGTPQAVLEEEELMKILVPILRADFSILETYVYQDYHPLNCPITVFGGLEDKRITKEELEAWSEGTQVSCSLNMFPGDHFFINSQASNMLPIIDQAFRGLN